MITNDIKRKSTVPRRNLKQPSGSFSISHENLFAAFWPTLQKSKIKRLLLHCMSNKATNKIWASPEIHNTNPALLGPDRTVMHLLQRTWHVSRAPVNAKHHLYWQLHRPQPHSSSAFILQLTDWLNQSTNQSCIFRVVQVIKSLQDPLEVQNNLPGINDNVR